MYIDIAVFILIVLAIIMYFKNFSSFVFSIAILDILLRILNFIKLNVGLPDLKKLLDRYFPDSVFGIIDKYTKGDINIILKWLFVIIMIFFLYYVIKTWLKKKKF